MKVDCPITYDLCSPIYAHIDIWSAVDFAHIV